MEQKKTVVLTGTEWFSKGSFENATLEDGYVIIERIAGQYMQYGCYISPQIALPPFCNLNVSWNADVPANTLIEVQCRVLADGVWSSWLSFGKWALDYPRKSFAHAKTENGEAFLSGDTLTVASPGGATAAQVKVSLFTNDEKVTPALRLLAIAARPIEWVQQCGAPLNEAHYLPQYTIANHASTAFGAQMQLPLVLTALMNRYGEDALPEEIAYGMADADNAACHNVAFGAAIVGCCGYECYQSWMDLKEVRAEIRSGCSLAVQLAEEGGAVASKLQWYALHGVTHDEATSMDQVLLMNPCAHGDEPVSMQLAMSRFTARFTGRVVVVRNNLHGLRKQRPVRVCCSAKPVEPLGAFALEVRGEPLALSEQFAGWVACAHKDGIAHATTAHRTFTALTKTEQGGVQFPPECVQDGARYTLYIVTESGVAYTAECTIPHAHRE